MKKVLLLFAVLALMVSVEGCKNSKKAQKQAPTQKVQGKVMNRDEWNKKH